MSESYWPIGGGGGGSVTDVTGTAPIVSSGGATPAISIATFAGSTPGAVPTSAGGDQTKYLKGSGAWDTPAGGVSSVTGTAPIVSSGGATPAISISAFTGDSGSGGANGAVPAPASGDSAAGKFLAAGGGWSVPSGGGGGTLSVQGMYLYDGTNYYVMPQMQIATLPVAGSFAWVNQGTATESAVQNGLVMTAPVSATSNLRMRVQSIGANTSLVACVSLTVEPLNYRYGGIVFRESATGKVIIIGIIDNNGILLQVTAYTNPTTFSATRFTYSGCGYPTRIWFKLTIGATLLSFFWSLDGINFALIWSELKTTFFTVTPDEWGYALNPEANSTGQSSDLYLTLLSFKMS